MILAWQQFRWIYGNEFSKPMIGEIRRASRSLVDLRYLSAWLKNLFSNGVIVATSLLAIIVADASPSFSTLIAVSCVLWFLSSPI